MSNLISKIRKKVALKLPSYTLPEIYRGPTDWYVSYSYLSPYTGKYERFKESYGLNKKDHIPLREEIATEIVDVITSQLKKGYNPFLKQLTAESADNQSKQEKVVVPEKVVVLAVLVKTGLNQILLDWKKTETKSQNKTYLQMFNRLSKYMEHSQTALVAASNVDIDYAILFQRYLMEIMKLAPKTVNATTSHVGLLFDELIRRKQALLNPFRNLSSITKKSYRGIEIDLDNDDHDFILLTATETQTAFKHLSVNHRGLFRYCGLIYWGFIRLSEICRLKVSDVNLREGVIRISKQDAKNSTAGYVQILQPMRTLLEEMNLEQYPGDYYLFSVDKRRKELGDDKMLPGLIPYTEERARKYWKLVVQKGLGIIKKIYALKHSGNIDYIINNKGNVDREWLKMQNRHKTRAQTDKYIERLNIYIIDESQYNFTQIPL